MPAYLDAHTVNTLLDPASLIDALREAFRTARQQPGRVHLDVANTSVDNATLLLMPAWSDAYIGTKIATIHPDNATHSLPSVHASYVLKRADTGEDVAILEGTSLTRRRTAAASALASTYLSREDASTLLMIGAGSLAVPLIEAHRAIRPINRVMVWNRSTARRRALEASLEQVIERVDDLDEAVGKADIISCATLSTEPLVRWSAVRPGTHVDLVGAYRNDMRESDSDLIANSAVFVDTYDGARHEAGDLAAAAAESSWSYDGIKADLAELCSNRHPGREAASEVTVFKSVGASLEDLAAAQLAWERFSA